MFFRVFIVNLAALGLFLCVMIKSFSLIPILLKAGP